MADHEKATAALETHGRALLDALCEAGFDFTNPAQSCPGTFIHTLRHPDSGAVLAEITFLVDHPRAFRRHTLGITNPWDDPMPSGLTRCKLCGETIAAEDMAAHVQTAHGIDLSWSWHPITLMQQGPPPVIVGVIEVLAESRDAALEFVREHEIGALEKVLDHPGRVRVEDPTTAAELARRTGTMHAGD